MQVHPFTRRALVAKGLRAAAVAAFAPPASRIFSQSGFRDYPHLAGVGRYTEPFRKQYRVSAMSLAFSKNGRFVYDHAGGMAVPEHAIQVQQNSLFRIADLSQSITAVAIFSLIEKGALSLESKVFGQGNILGTKYGKPPYQPYVTDITVDHLLTNTAGGWAADDKDPMLHNNGWDWEKLIRSTIQNDPLTYPPGTKWIYSNFGNCVLGRVIEQLTGQSYEVFVQSTILGPCGITGMQIGRNSERQRAPNEVVYVGQYSENPYKINISRMDSSAGWIASSTDLVQFLNHVAGAPGIPALLKPETIRAMTTPAPAYPPGSARYARGWMVNNNGSGSWWHAGSIPGSTALMVRNPDDSCSAVICNTRSQPHQEMDDALFRMVRTFEQNVRG